MHKNLFNYIDLIIAPFVLLVIYLIIRSLKKKQPLNTQKYFIPAFSLRILGTFLTTGITEFYYKYGDTYVYYYHTQLLRSYFLKDPLSWLKLLFSDPSKSSTEVDTYLNMIDGENTLYLTLIFQNTLNATTCKIASVINIFCLNSYVSIALIFGLLSFLGCWYIYKTFIYIFPNYEKQYAIFCLFLPSLWFWGSGLLKDPLCIFFLGILVYNIFVGNKILLTRIILILFSSFFLLNTKPYIFYTFGVAFVFGYIIGYIKQKSWVAKFFVLFILLFVFVLLQSTIVDLVQNFIEDIIKDTQKNLEIYTNISQEGDSFILTTLNPTPIGLLQFGIEGFINSYMKPYPWQINKVLYLFVILENLLMFYLFFIKIKPSSIIMGNKQSKFIYFSVIFFIFLGVIIGMTTFNLGTIVRYRVPGLPFLFAGIFSFRLLSKSKRAVTLGTII